MAEEGFKRKLTFFSRSVVGQNISGGDNMQCPRCHSENPEATPFEYVKEKTV